MVFPKPGLKYRYQYKLPDHVQRQITRKNRDHTKIYDLLSDDDLYDIRGAGLLKLDQEEIARFEKEKELNEKDAANNRTVQVVVSKSTNASRSKRVRLMPQVKEPEELKDKTEVQEDKKEEKEDVNTETSVEQKEAIPPIVIKIDKTYKRKRGKKGGKRGRKRKVEENKTTEDAGTVTVPIAQSSIKDDSSKENETEETNASELRLSPKRTKEPSARKTFSDAIWKEWRSVGTLRTIEKKLAIGYDFMTENGASDRMDSGQVKIKLSSLNYVQATWPKAKAKCTKKVKARTPKRGKKQKQSVTPNAISPNQAVKKSRKPYKKRTSAESPKKMKASSSKVKSSCRPIQELTTTQILRKVRYTIDKYFATMPGTSYRCPSMLDSSHTYESDDPVTGKKVWLCLVCHKEELDEHGDIMICCDLCEDWYHLRCIGVPDERYPENMKWYCKRCMAREIRAGTFDPKKFPLFL